MAITPQMVKELREKTGCGMMDCKKALNEHQGDFEKATDFLRKKGLAAAAKRADRVASQGVVESYIHLGNKIGVLVEVNSESDFVARNDDFNKFVKDIAMQIVASAPSYIKPEEVPAEELEKEKDVYKEQLKNEGKPEQVMDKIIEGKLNKYYEEVCLMNQKFIKDDSLTIKQLLEKNGNDIKITRFVRYQV